MKKSRNFRIALFFFPIFGLVFSTSSHFAKAEENNVKIENNVVTSSDSGGNIGSGTINTGSASASSKVKNNISGSDDIKISTDAKAQANGETAEVKTEGSGSVDIKQESSDGNSSAEVSVETKNTNEIGIGENGESQPKPFFKKVWNFISSLFS
jgi:hypothetical protein